MTIRWNLQWLADNGTVTRTHGGARLAERVGPEMAFQSCVQENIDTKRAIGEVAYCLSRPHATFLQLARRLRLGPLPLTVFTDGLAGAQDLVHLEGLSVDLLGGTTVQREPVGGWSLRRAPAGRALIQSIEPGRQHRALRSPDGHIESRRGQSQPGRDCPHLASQAILLADASKLGSSAPDAGAPLADIHTVITGSTMDAVWKTHMAELRIDTTYVPIGRSL